MELQAMEMKLQLINDLKSLHATHAATQDAAQAQVLSPAPSAPVIDASVSSTPATAAPLPVTPADV